MTDTAAKLYPQDVINMCLYPKLITNRKYTPNKKNGGIIPAISDERVLKVAVGCQNCIECRKQKAREWQVRLLEDIKHNTNGKFITLTFSNESIKKIVVHIRDTNGDPFQIPEGYELDNAIATRGMRLFLERWRKKFKKSLRHWMVSELGHDGTENIHLHGIVWTDETVETIRNIWQYGYIWPRENWKGTYVNAKTVNYIIKYLTKQDEKHRNYKGRILTSAGIGRGYVQNPKGQWTKNKYNGDNTNETYRTDTGHKIGMPVYWRNKIYNDEEREKLWLQKLDKQERWILGNRVDISQNDNEYIKGLEYARQRNKELGYGDNYIDIEQKIYEHERRIIMQQTRIKKANNNNNNNE